MIEYFASPHDKLSPFVLTKVNQILQEIKQNNTKKHLLAHLERGLKQINVFLETNHTTTDGRVLTFQEIVQRDTQIWQEHVEKAQSNKNMKVTKRFLPPGVLDSTKCTLMDLKVGRPGRPDDAVYQTSEYARKYMPRGNFIAQWTLDNGVITYFPILRAYRKFTGHEDGGETIHNKDISSELLSKFFSKPITEAKYAISTTKENGEAAHLAILKTAQGEFLYVIGSKNTHTIIRNLQDMDIVRQLESDGDKGNDPFLGAGPIGVALIKLLNRMDQDKRRFLCEFLWQTRLTCSFEMLCPGHQHVQRLHFEEDTAVMFGLSFPIWEPLEGAEICLNPILGFEIMRFCRVRTVEYSVHNIKEHDFQATLHTIKHGYQYEGAVNLFLDENACVIGMDKFKTAWYVCLRAIREKAKNYLSNVYGKNKKQDKYEALEYSKKSITKRFKDIRTYLNLSEEICQAYVALGHGFVEFLCHEKIENHRQKEDKAHQHQVMESVANFFPVTWEEYLQVKEKNDRVL